MSTQTATRSDRRRPLVEEAAGAVNLLESVHYGEMELVEADGGKGKPKQFILKGEFGRADRATENKRFYGRQIVERELSRLTPSIEGRSVYGELDHPQDGRTSLNRVSHLITKLELRDDGVVYGEAVILPTERGRNLQAILSAGGRVGVSSRGFGSVKQNARGESVVQEDFKLVTYDVVADPADKDAWPESFHENRGNLDMPDIANLTESQLREQHPELFEAIEAKAKLALQEENAKLAAENSSLKERAFEAKEQGRVEAVEEAATKTAKLVEEHKQKLADQIRGELMTDPKVAGALTFVENLKDQLRPYLLSEDAEAVVAQKDDEISRLRASVIERDEKISALEQENEALEKMARTAGYRYHLETLVQGDENADLIKHLVGDVSAFQSATEIEERVVGVRAELQTREEERKKQEEQRKKELDKVRSEERAQVEALSAKVNELSTALEKSLKLNNQLALEDYAAERLKNHPRRVAIIEHMEENGAPSSKAAFDHLLDQFRVNKPTEERMESVRARVRGAMHSSGARQSDDPLHESRPRDDDDNVVVLEDVDTPAGRGFNGTGMDLGVLKQLSGIGQG